VADEEYDHLDYSRTNLGSNPNYTRMETIPTIPRSGRSTASITSNNHTPKLTNGIGNGLHSSSSTSTLQNNLNTDNSPPKEHNHKLALFNGSSEDNDD